MSLWIIVLYIIIGLIILFLISSYIGRQLIKKWQKEFDEKALLQCWGKFITNSAGRRVEYYVYGSKDKNAPVIVNIHGSWLEALFEKWLYENVCEQLDVKWIAISLPWTWYTDMKIGRKIIDWVQEDLEPVLQKENVWDFYITGHSQGTPHAMATAYHCKDRCKGMGLNAPLLPNSMSKKIWVEKAIGWDSLPTTKKLQTPLMSWYFTMLSMFLFFPSLPVYYISKTTPKLSDDPALIERIKKSSKRSTIRWTIGNVWESAKDVCYEWWFDPSLIENKNICIWHAKDDAQCPPAIGKWLAENFLNKWATVNFKDKSQWFGHFTYCRWAFLEPKNSMIHALTQSLKV